jgi:hypothetical protein
MPYSFQIITTGGVGGTRFGLGMESPILFINTDRPEDESWTLFRQYRKIERIDFYPITSMLTAKDTLDEIKRKNSEIFEFLLQTINQAKAKGYKSIFIDTLTMIWKILIPLATFAKTDKIPQDQRGILNNYAIMLINELWRSGLNFGYTVRLKEEYKKNSPTGNMIPDFAKDCDTYAQTNIWLFRQAVPNTGTNQWPFDGQEHFCARITKCNPNPLLVNQWLYDAQISYDFIVQMIQQPYKVA